MIEEPTKELGIINSLPEACYQKAREFNEDVIRLDGIASDPQLLKKKIDIVSDLGVAGERRNIGMNCLAIDSRLIASNEPETISLKNSGPSGEGKSYLTDKTLLIYPNNCYVRISSSSTKNILYKGDSLKNKVVFLSEAFTLENDKGAAYFWRTLLTEGFIKHDSSRSSPEGRVEDVYQVEGPISLITTTISPKLEKQLDNRLFTIHPNSSPENKKVKIMQMAKSAKGMNNKRELEAKVQDLKKFHDWLLPRRVVIPFMEIIATKFFEKNEILADGVSRVFKRVISSIKTITILYQGQRLENEDGELEADMADYAMAYQLINKSIIEDLQGGSEQPDKYLDAIRSAGMITLKKLADMLGVKNSTASEAVSIRVGQGRIFWCDVNGQPFENQTKADRAKCKPGSAFLCANSPKGLPTPYELTGDSFWQPGGELHIKYDLHLD